MIHLPEFWKGKGCSYTPSSHIESIRNGNGYGNGRYNVSESGNGSGTGYYYSNGSGFNSKGFNMAIFLSENNGE